MSESDFLRGLALVIEAFEQLGVDYHLGGSVVSSAYGVPRSTLDIDVVADLRPEHVAALVKKLGADFMVEEGAVREAVSRRATFNVIHIETVVKIDVFVLAARPFEREAFRRRREDSLALGDAARSYYLATAEDVVLHKLHWYRLGEEVARRQWDDVLGVLGVQGSALDLPYMRRWAAELGVEDLLSRALSEADVESEGDAGE